MKRIIIKAILYRVITNFVVQTGSWILFRKIEINVVFALWEVFRTIFYFVYDYMWEKIGKR